MLDEDTVLKSVRYSNEKILILNICTAVCVPTLFVGGTNVFALCIFFSLGLLSILNVMSYPTNWIDAPEYTRTKYFLLLSPYIAIILLSIYRI